MDGPPLAGLRIAMALYGDVTFDSRVQREAEALSRAGHAVTVFCLSGTVTEAPYRVVSQRPDRSEILPDGSSPFRRAGRSTILAETIPRIRWITGYARNIRGWGRW